MKHYLVVREAGNGSVMFTTKDPREWKSSLQDLGKVCGTAWRDDLAEEEERAWAEAHRKEFNHWVDGRVAPPWPMLIAAVKRAFVAGYGALERKPTTEAEALARLDRTYLGKLLTADDVAQGHGPEALRAFQRGFRLGRSERPFSTKRNIPRMVDPPYHWYRQQAEANLLGPSAARERALVAAWRASGASREDVEASQHALRELHASAWRQDVPEEDRAWAEAYRETCAHWVTVHRRDVVAQSAYEAYLRSSDGILDGEPAPPWSKRRHRDSEPWRFVADRVEDAPEDESELATAEAAAREYWDARWREVPPWDGDPSQVQLARGGPRRAGDVGGDGRPHPEALVAVAPSSDPDG
ncbi:hypothetical protein WME79_48170 [Sorangium sp. So ce726]|uniref:hypothetical protein n=1 Tax=Sorangium sp. So ce726 TaxID=3133319 RepID=UPI003F5D9294